jgi:hypothetical protein
VKVGTPDTSPTAGLEPGARVDPLHPPRPYGNDDPPDTWWRRHFLAICLGVFCTAAAVLVVQQVGWKGLIGFAPQSTIPPSVLKQDAEATAAFRPVVQHIYDVTNRAFQQRDAALLSQVYTDQCQCLAQGRSYIDQLLAKGEVLGGGGTQLVAVEALEVKSHDVLLRVTDQVPAFPILNGQGQVVAQDPGRQPTEFTMDLTRQGGVWKVSDVVILDDTLP